MIMNIASIGLRKASNKLLKLQPMHEWPCLPGRSVHIRYKHMHFHKPGTWHNTVHTGNEMVWLSQGSWITNCFDLDNNSIQFIIEKLCPAHYFAQTSFGQLHQSFKHPPPWRLPEIECSFDSLTRQILLYLTLLQYQLTSTLESLTVVRQYPTWDSLSWYQRSEKCGGNHVGQGHIQDFRKGFLKLINNSYNTC